MANWGNLLIKIGRAFRKKNPKSAHDIKTNEKKISGRQKALKISAETKILAFCHVYCMLDYVMSATTDLLASFIQFI
jgi:hypothetical protein